MDDRRTFLKNTFAAALTPAVPSILSEKKKFFEQQSIQLEIYATNWGFQGSVFEFCQKAKQAGYIGIEVWAPLDPKGQQELRQAVTDNELKLAMLCGNYGATFESNLNVFEKSLDSAISLEPEFINCHSGKDHYTHDQSSHFIELAKKKEGESGISILHETHRGKIMFSAPTAEHFLNKYDFLQFTLDISHWCCVHESLLADQKDRIDRVLERTGHIHARVGFQEGPQIPDPRDEQFANAINAHFDWWDRVIEHRTKEGKKVTMTTEFGPPGYMWTLPYTKAPVANNWDINIVMKELWEERYLSS